MVNDQRIEKYGSNAVKRRIKRELEKMYAKYDKIVVYINERGFPQITIYEKVDDSKEVIDLKPSQFMHKYDFILSENYPFVPPTVFFQNREHKEFTRLNCINHNLLFKKVTGLDCLCCHSIICRSNWSPGYTLNNIIDEIHQFKQKRRNVLNKIFADVIVRKYLISDINLESWLFEAAK